MTPDSGVDANSMAATKTLGDYVALQRGTTYRSALLGQPGPVLLGLASIQRNGGFRHDKLRTYGGDSPEKLVLGPGTMYVSLKDVTQSGDLLGAVARVPDGIGFGRLTQDTVKLKPVNSDIPSQYIYWALLTPQYRAYCRQRAMGTTNLSLSRADFLAFPLPAATRKRLILVELLELLEAKIESNRRLATLLEQALTTMFHARFVDVLGVGGHMSEQVGQVPAGWRFGCLAELADFVNGKAFTKHANGLGRPILRIKELKAGVTGSTPWTDVAADSKHLAGYDDILFAWSGSLDVYRWSGQESLINQHVFKVIPRSLPAWFVFGWIRQHMTEFQAIARDKATTMGHIQRKHLSEARVLLPDGEELAQADAQLAPLDARRSVAIREIQTLTDIREALLPKLISGEFGVQETGDIDELVGAVAEEVSG